MTSTVAWVVAMWTRVLGWDIVAGSGAGRGGREEQGLLLGTVWLTLTGLAGWARPWRHLGSWYSDRSILRPILGRGASHVVWCLYMARKLSPTFFQLKKHIQHPCKRPDT